MVFYFVYTKVLYYCHHVTWSQSLLVYFHVYGPLYHLRRLVVTCKTAFNAYCLELREPDVILLHVMKKRLEEFNQFYLKMFTMFYF